MSGTIDGEREEEDATWWSGGIISEGREGGRGRIASLPSHWDLPVCLSDWLKRSVEVRLHRIGQRSVVD